MFKLFTF